MSESVMSAAKRVDAIGGAGESFDPSIRLITDRPPAPRPAATSINHPGHYGGGGNPYETILVIEAWGLGFCDGNVLKYLSRWRQKGGIQDLEKASWYLSRFIEEQRALAKTGATAVAKAIAGEGEGQ